MTFNKLEVILCLFYFYCQCSLALCHTYLSAKSIQLVQGVRYIIGWGVDKSLQKTISLLDVGVTTNATDKSLLKKVNFCRVIWQGLCK